MEKLNLLVIAPPELPHLRTLKRLPDSINVQIGNDSDFLKAAAGEADIVLNAWLSGRELRALWPFLTKIRWVHNLSAGVEHVLTPEAIASPVPLTNGRGVFADSLGEFVLGAIFFFAKDFRRMLKNQQAGRWEPFDVEWVRGKTLGIVGFGAIGREAARLARGVGMNILAVRRRPYAGDNELAHEVFSPERLQEMLARCDYVAVAAALTNETRGLIGERELAAMKRTAVLMNVGRGPVIVESALIRALRQGLLRGAALDVFDREPLPDGHPFYQMENVLLSPHTGDHTAGWVELAMDVFFENFEHFTKGEPLVNIVDKSAGY